MSKHTPGPWKVHKYEYGGPFYDVMTDNTGIAAIVSTERHGYSSRIPKNEEAEANARLIASAPELLDALKLALSELGGNDPNDLAYESEVIGTIRQAIAKAEGTL